MKGTLPFLLWGLAFLGLLTPAEAQSISSFELIDANADLPIGPLENGDTLFLDQLPSNALNINALTNPAVVGSVVFDFNGQANFQTENVEPYALFGNSGNDYNGWTPNPGWYDLTATAYSGANGTGTSGSSLTISFYVASGPPILCEGDEGPHLVSLEGELKKWHKLSLKIDGPYAEEQCTPNPFLDYRLVVQFEHPASGTTYRVPGYFAADGDAAESSASSGTIWYCHFAPDAIGAWEYTISFRTGTNLAIEDDLSLGTPISVHGQTGTFDILATDKTGRDHRGKGRLQYVDGHYLQFAETGEYFLKIGADAPETFLAYEEFDNTYHQNGNNNLKDWAPHIGDWQAGDPSWQNGKGKGIIGALNYLVEAEQNAFSFITNNIGGDGKNVWMYTDPSDFFRFDVSKLAQWEIVFSHADQLGLYLHFKTQETENDQLLDGGALGNARKLYYRELIARFGHHLALNWNLGEENTQTDNQRIAMADYFYEHDPYRHHIVIHTYPNDQENVYEPLLGNASRLTGASVQTNWSSVHERTLQWVEESANAGKPWVVANDEQGNANYGVPPNVGYQGWNGGNPSVHDIRKAVLWGNLMAGGAGVEYYFGYSLPQNDLNCEDYRSRSDIWAYNALAVDFFHTHIPFTTMRNRNDLVGNDNNDNDLYCLANAGADYVIYLAEGGSTELLLNDTANVYQVRWFDPRNGGDLQLGTLDSLQGMGWQSIGDPPNEADQDWVVWISRVEETVNSLNEVSSKMLKGYPNPTNGNIWLEQLPPGRGYIQVFDPLGRMVYQSSEWVIAEGDIRRVPTAFLSPGLYTLRWSSTNTSTDQTLRFLKQ